MTNTSLRLRKQLPDNRSEILHLLFTVASKLKIDAFVVGATARDLIFEFVYEAKIQRATEDIDFGVAVRNWQEYEKLKTALIETGKFIDDPRNEQRIQWVAGDPKMRVDLVPYGGVELPEGGIAFPPDGDFTMSTLGFDAAFENSLLLEINEDLTIRTASLAGLALLKFVAYSDRPQERRRDVQDIYFIAANYMKADNDDRLFGENVSDADLLTDDFNYETCGARLLGRDIAPLLNEEARAIVMKILGDENEGGSLQKFADIIHSEGLRDEDIYEKIVIMLGEIRNGIIEKL